MQKWDWVFDYAAAPGMNIELIIWGYGVAGGEGLWASPVEPGSLDQSLVNRYKRRPNLFMFTIANEFERYPDGKYQYDPADVEWARGVAARSANWIRSIPSAATPPSGSRIKMLRTKVQDRSPPTRDSHNVRPQVVWPLWEGSAVNLNVTQNNEGVQPRTWGDFDGPRGD